MDLAKMAAEFQTKAENMAPIGGKLKLKLDDMVVTVDGTGDKNVIIPADVDADCTITTSMKTFDKLSKGDINPMMAVMTGKIKIKGDMGLAMKLQSLLG